MKLSVQRSLIPHVKEFDTLLRICKVSERSLRNVYFIEKTPSSRNFTQECSWVKSNVSQDSQPISTKQSLKWKLFTSASFFEKKIFEKCQHYEVFAKKF